MSAGYTKESAGAETRLFWRPEKSAVILLHDRAGAAKGGATVEQSSPSVANSVRRQNP